MSGLSKEYDKDFLLNNVILHEGNGPNLYRADDHYPTNWEFSHGQIVNTLLPEVTVGGSFLLCALSNQFIHTSGESAFFTKKLFGNRPKFKDIDLLLPLSFFDKYLEDDKGTGLKQDVQYWNRTNNFIIDGYEERFKFFRLSGECDLIELTRGLVHYNKLCSEFGGAVADLVTKRKLPDRITFDILMMDDVLYASYLFAINQFIDACRADKFREKAEDKQFRIGFYESCKRLYLNAEGIK